MTLSDWCRSSGSLSMSGANGSKIVTVQTPSGEIEVARLRRRSEPPASDWEWVWIARRGGETDWRRGASAREAIGLATGLEAGAWPGWLAEAAGKAEQELTR
jgi:hypothetical protein